MGLIILLIDNHKYLLQACTKQFAHLIILDENKFFKNKTDFHIDFEKNVIEEISFSNSPYGKIKSGDKSFYDFLKTLKIQHFKEAIKPYM